VADRGPELARNRTASERILDTLNTLDIVYVAMLLACAIGLGAYAVGGWILEAWRTGAWWSLALLSSASLFLLAGTLRELVRRRVGAFSLVTGVVCLMLGISHAFSH
jgi:hypothetical protein